MLKLQYFGHLMQRANSLEKTPMLGKIEGRKMRWLDGITDSTDMSLIKLMSVESVMPSNHLIFLPSIFPSIGVFSNELALCIRWPKYWSFSIGPSNEYPG